MLVSFFKYLFTRTVKYNLNLKIFEVLNSPTGLFSVAEVLFDSNYFFLDCDRRGLSDFLNGNDRPFSLVNVNRTGSNFYF